MRVSAVSAVLALAMGASGSLLGRSITRAQAPKVMGLTPSAGCIAVSTDLPTAARSAAEAMHMHAMEGVKAHGLARRADLGP